MSTHNSPRLTAGHHFSDLLICPYKAWLHYFGDTGQQVEAPPFLRALQQEGLAYEEEVYQNKYPGALRIRGGKREQRLKDTYDAMCAGEPIILQGYVLTKEGVGVLDILERVGSDPTSKTKHAYHVGEIKSSSSLKTAHILQVCWYAELLKEAFTQDTKKGFVILGDYHFVPLDLTDYKKDYVQARQSLFNIRDGKVVPEPHLTSFCPSCDWRMVCMLMLVSQDHISLLPGFSRNHVHSLKEQGVTTWQDIKNLPDQALFDLGLTRYKAQLTRSNIANLEGNVPALRQQLRSDLLNNATVLVVEIPDLKLQRESGSPLRPSAIILERAGTTRKVPIHYHGDAPSADLSCLENVRTVLVYGSTDLHIFQRLARQVEFPLKKVIVLDLLTLIENHVHYPFHGLELDTVQNHVYSIDNSASERLTPEKRARAIRTVSDWIQRALW
jgi:CRISPR/Cas system-associated exonuclease Cas4 (RecB family)